VFPIAGPCGGKTTGQTRLCTFFENMGWKVGRDPLNFNFTKDFRERREKKRGTLFSLLLLPP